MRAAGARAADDAAASASLICRFRYYADAMMLIIDMAFFHAI